MLLNRDMPSDCGPSLETRDSQRLIEPYPFCPATTAGCTIGNTGSAHPYRRPTLGADLRAARRNRLFYLEIAVFQRGWPLTSPPRITARSEIGPYRLFLVITARSEIGPYRLFLVITARSEMKPSAVTARSRVAEISKGEAGCAWLLTTRDFCGLVLMTSSLVSGGL